MSGALVDKFNREPAGLVVVLPVTSRVRGIPRHVIIDPPEGGLVKKSAAMPEMVRSTSVSRLLRRIGHVEARTLERAATHLAALLGLPPPQCS